MHHPFRSFFFAVAVPVVFAVFAGSVSAKTAKYKIERVKPFVSPSRTARTDSGVLRRCLLPHRWIFASEQNRARRGGYRNVRIVRFNQSRRLCYQFVRLTACRRRHVIVISVRYRHGRRIFTHHGFRGYCIVQRVVDRLKNAP